MLVRVTDMRGVDLNRYVFDTGLTLAILWMNADGTVYHRYGGRDVRSPDQWLSTVSLGEGMRAGLAAHSTHEALAREAGGREATPPEDKGTPLTLERVPSFVKRDKGECIHCHSVRPALYEEELTAGTWGPEKTWRFPPPSRVGLDLARDMQQRVTAVAEGSAAHRAGIKPGDLLTTMNGHTIATATDVMFAQDAFPVEGGKMRVTVSREGSPHAATLDLGPTWKVGTALDFSWRSFKWGLTPAPGFGGTQLAEEELAQLGVRGKGDGVPFAFRVTYLVTWGENRRFGQAAKEAGLREGDVVIGLYAEGDPTNQLNPITSVDHFHAWWRLHVQAGDSIQVDILRDREPESLRLAAIP